MDTFKIKKIDYRIVRMRAFAILVVMFGHSIILYNSSWRLYETKNVSKFLDVVKEIINTFQMPLFLAISGYCFYFSTLKKRNGKNDIVKEIKNKFVHLMVPFFFIALGYMIPIRILCNYANWKERNYFQIVQEVILGKDSGHLWFLPTLFYIFIVSYIGLSKQTKVKEDVLILIGAFVCTVVASRIPIFMFINNFVSSFYWFLLGFYINKYIILKRNMVDSRSYFFFWFCCGIVVFNVIFVRNPYIHLLLEKVVISIVIILAFTIVSNKKCGSLTMLISELSMGMYLLHSPLIYITFSMIPNAEPFWVVSINFVLFGTMSMLLSYMIKKSKFKMIIGY